jgi:hypothetical protein
VYAVLRDIFAALHARTIFGFRRSAASSGSRHGNALGTRFDGRFDIIPLTVQMNVTTAILDASRFFRRRAIRDYEKLTATKKVLKFHGYFFLF